MMSMFVMSDNCNTPPKNATVTYIIYDIVGLMQSAGTDSLQRQVFTA